MTTPRLDTRPLAFLLVLAATVAAPASASAAPDFACRASAARISGVGPLQGVASEPIRANAPANPCTTQSAETVKRTTAGPATADALGAFTLLESLAATVLASASNPKVELPGLVVEAAAVQASAGVACSLGVPVKPTGASKVVNLVVNGNAIQVPPGDEFFELDLSPAGKIVLNEQVVEGTVLTQRAVHITTPAAEVVLAEAVAGTGSGGCGSATPPGTGGPTPSGTGPNAPAGPTPIPAPCPPGSSYDPGANVCIIQASAPGSTTGSGTGSPIIVGPPFQGPSGGSVLGVNAAKQLYKSPCLSGKGSPYVIVGTNGKDSITGTNKRDRILLLAGRDRAEGGRGNDCIDGGSGVDTLSGALGSDRLYGGSGNDHLVGGSHSDQLNGGSGHDTVNTGFGKDRVDGGAGNDRINAATAGKGARRIQCGKGRDKVRVNRNERKVVRRCERVYVSR